jgi:predicted DNA-binding transcriptional regulator
MGGCSKKWRTFILKYWMVECMRNIILDIEKILENLKFKPSDAKIYSLLLEKGEMRVSEIAEELDLSARFVRIG